MRTHVCGIWKNEKDYLIFKEERETDIEKNVWISRGKGWDELGD